MTKRVLIVEDEKKIRGIYTKLLKSLGLPSAHIFEAESAVTATSILSDEKIQLVLLDINLPTIDGIILYDVIRQYSPDLDIVVASVYPVDQQRELCPGAKDYYDKAQGPFALLEKLTPLI